MNLFQEELETTAIDRIQRFAKIAETMGFDICLGFSGGKDSQVVYDLCKRSGVPFKAYFNRSFESPVTKNFIRQNYPDVIWRHDHRYGFIENIRKVHGGLFLLLLRLSVARITSIIRSMSINVRLRVSERLKVASAKAGLQFRSRIRRN